MTFYLDDEVEHWLTAIHEAGHTLAVLEIEKAEVGLLDEVVIDEDEGETTWFSSDEVFIDPMLRTSVEVAGMAAGKVMLPSTEWWAGAEQDVERAIEHSGPEGMKKTMVVVVRELKKPHNKVRLLAIAMLLLEKKKLDRDDVLDVLGE